MSSQDENKWGDFKVTIGGKEIEGIKSFTFKPSLAQLKNQLKEALESEDYLLCAEIQKEIDNYKKE